ncbi:TIGR03118 family protein [Limobrevibacterium gyesilva]|nr:TIGR03118 family protein [Limobrevibacterium gyesilva]
MDSLLSMFSRLHDSMLDHEGGDDHGRHGHHHENDRDNAYTQTNLISDGFVPAANINPDLINPWGMSFSPTGPFWVSDNGAGVASINDGAGNPVVVAGGSEKTIATPPGQQPGTASPTGQVFNAFRTEGAFTLSNGSPAAFLFATEDGTISGWNGGSQSILAVDNSSNPSAGSDGEGAVYKGLAIGETAKGVFLYAANFRHGTVDVFDQNFMPVKSFTDPKLPAGYAPFNVQVLDGKLFVTFALQNADKHDDVAGAGHGFVDEFSLDGHMLHRVASGGVLNSPWGLAIAPSHFGEFSNDLLIGNFGDGKIDAFNPKNDHFEGKLLGPDGKPIVIGDLWALSTGNASAGSDPNALYFTAGVLNEAHGLFGSLTAAPDTDPGKMTGPSAHSGNG